MEGEQSVHRPRDRCAVEGAPDQRVRHEKSSTRSARAGRLDTPTQGVACIQVERQHRLRAWGIHAPLAWPAQIATTEQNAGQSRERDQRAKLSGVAVRATWATRRARAAEGVERRARANATTSLPQTATAVSFVALFMASTVGHPVPGTQYGGRSVPTGSTSRCSTPRGRRCGCRRIGVEQQLRVLRECCKAQVERDESELVTRDDGVGLPLREGVEALPRCVFDA